MTVDFVVMALGIREPIRHGQNSWDEVLADLELEIEMKLRTVIRP